MTKRQAQRAHARRRAFERYGMDVGAATRKEIIQAIQSGKSKCEGRHSLRATNHVVTLASGQTVRVAYDRQRKEIITFLPME